jgi:hypothetical protein
MDLRKAMKSNAPLPAFTLTVCADLVIAAAHFGGGLARGPDFLSKFSKVGLRPIGKSGF